MRTSTKVFFISSIASSLMAILVLCLVLLSVHETIWLSSLRRLLGVRDIGVIDGSFVLFIGTRDMRYVSFWPAVGCCMILPICSFLTQDRFLRSRWTQALSFSAVMVPTLLFVATNLVLAPADLLLNASITGACTIAVLCGIFLHRRLPHLVFHTLCWRKLRRFARNLCTHCGYDLRATPHRCPECGREPTYPRLPRAALALASRLL